MLLWGQIEPSDSPWVSPVALVTKKYGSKRFCVDYRRLNSLTTKDAYPLPRIDDSLQLQGNQLWFSTMDISGYWQVAMSPEAKWKAAFVTNVGLFQFRVMSDTARVSVLPVAGCKFPAVFLGKVALDVFGLGVGPPCLSVDSEETLLTLMDERAQLVRAAPGVTPEDGSEEGAPVLELIEHLVLGKSLVDSLQEPMPAMKRLKQAIMVTVSVWEPLEHLHCVVSDDVDFDSFWMAPWDAGWTLGDSCGLCVIFWRTLLRSMIRLSGRPAIVVDMSMKIKT